MDEVSRLRIVRALACVNKAMVSIDDDASVCRSIKSIHKQYYDDPFVSGIYFMNGGDRGQGTVPETDICEELDIKMIYNVGGIKTESSSTLLEKVANEKQG